MRTSKPSTVLDMEFKNRVVFKRMSYRVTIEGLTVEMDTPEEVYRLLTKSATNGDTIALIEGRPTRQIWTEHSAVRLINSLPEGSLQMRAIRKLYYGDPNGLSQAELLKVLEIPNPQQAGGVLSGLAKNAKKVGAPNPIRIDRTRNQAGERTYRYRLDPDFRKAVQIAEQKTKQNRDEESRDRTRAQKS